MPTQHSKGKKGKEPLDKGKGRAIEDDEGEDEMEVEVGVGTTEINTTDTICNKAIISICRMDILNPPTPMIFGMWNKRLVVEKEAQRLAKEMTNTKFCPFATANLLPLIIKRNALDDSCIQLG